MKMMPRGAGALHYAHVSSALDIASSSNSSMLEKLAADPAFSGFIGMAKRRVKNGHPLDSYDEQHEQVQYFAEEFGLTTSEVVAVVRGLVDDGLENVTPRTGGDLDQLEILSDEFAKLVDPVGFKSRNFFTTPISPTPALGRYFEKIVLVKRLREVRAFIGFSRLKGDIENMLPPDLGTSQSDWLPATEVVGEGIFLEFSSGAVKSWLDANLQSLESAMARQALAAEEDGLPGRFGFNANPPFVMAHTFAHALVKQLAFSCGYSSSSLRERIYCKPTDDIGVGVLIYTADSDSEGSMGGLVEMGNPARLEPIIHQALENIRWCSNDPVCREHDDHVSYSRAACHACSFIAETSCAFQNTMLNRLLVTGKGAAGADGKREPLGFFASMVGE